MKEKNRIILVGTITHDIQPDLLYGKELYYNTYMEVKQPSGYVDQIMLVGKQKKFERNGVRPGKRVYIEGVVETRNEYDREGNRHVILYVRVITLRAIHKGKDRNEVVLKGRIIKRPSRHVMASGIIKASLILEVESADEHIVSYVPCVGYKRVAEILIALDSYEEIDIQGHYQSRIYTRSGEKQENVAREIFIHNIT